ncbi:MAG TPA: ABC-F family ATP-binding cassette domain-containing protein, partial [bacterium]|nr:ABC-F family ATP-binding cassette domain-containing protein [bacterium]
MAILTSSDLAKSHGATPVLRSVTFSVESAEKVALIGRNGSGKTTLLRLLAGLEDPDSGSVSRPRWAKVGYLAQIPTGAGDASVLSHVLSGAADVHALEARLRELEQLMADPTVHDDAPHLAEVMDEYGGVRHHFEHAGGFALDARAHAVLGGLGFPEAWLTSALDTLSGGWRVRADLARVLLGEPDLLLLDEPTNHLDLAATEWLEEYLRAFPGAAIVVSHDRRLLDVVTSRTLELEAGSVTSFPGPYSKYTTLKAQQVVQQAEAYRRHQEEVERLEAYIRRYHAGVRAGQAKSRAKRLARLTASPAPAQKEMPVMRPAAREVPLAGRVVVRLQGVGKRYADSDILSDVDLEIYRAERIGLLGANGVGKTTLLKVIAGLEPPSRGRVMLGSGVRAHYFAQEPAADLNGERTVLETVLADRPMTPEQVRTYLGRFLFSGEDVFKRVSMLSGGERQRLNLATLLLDRPNVLLLDEPTNHLDIPSREALEAALLEFSGTLMVATHDRYLLERIVTRILTVAEGHVTDFRGTYGELRAKRSPPAHRGGQTRRPAPAARPRPGRTARPPAPTFDQLAAQIAATERELAAAGQQLSDPELYRDGERTKAT